MPRPAHPQGGERQPRLLRRARWWTSRSRRTSTSCRSTSSSSACTTSTSASERRCPPTSSSRCSTPSSGAASPRSSSSRTTRSSTPRDLGKLDVDAMGRFFPHAELAARSSRRLPEERQPQLQRDVHVPRGRRHPVRARAAARRGRGARGAGRAAPVRGPRGQGGHHHAAQHPLRAPDQLGAASTRCSRLAACRTTPARLSYNQVEVWNLGFDRKGATGLSLGVLPAARRLVLPGGLLRQHLRVRPHEPLRGAGRRATARRPVAAESLRRRAARPRARGLHRRRTSWCRSTTW
jgi:hypothetical protein